MVLQNQSFRGVLEKKVFLKISQNSQENTCARVSFLIKLQALAQVFSCEVCEIFKKSFFYRTTLVAASGAKDSLMIAAVYVIFIFHCDFVIKKAHLMNVVK